MYLVEYTCTRNDTSVTMKSIITARPSMWMPTSNFTFEFCHHVKPRSTEVTPLSCVGRSARPNPPMASLPLWSSTRWIHWTPAMHDSTNDAPTVPTASSAPLRGRRFPNSRTAAKPSAGRSGMIQALRSMSPSALELVDSVEVGTVHVPVDQQDDREAHPHLGGGDRDDEEGEHLARDLLGEGSERDQVDVDGVEHELDGEQDEHAVAAGEHAVHPGAEEERAEDEVLVQRHGQSLRAITPAPTRAARSSIETTSKGTTDVRKMEAATGPVRLARRSESVSLISSCPKAFTSSAMRTPRRKRATIAAGPRWSLSKLAAVIGARVSMMPNRNSTAMAPM